MILHDHCMWSTSVPQDGKHDDATAQLAIGNVRICHYYMISVALVLAFYPLWTIGGPQTVAFKSQN